MANYRVGFHTGAYSSVVIEADSAAEALEKADGIFAEVQPGLCAHCCGMFNGVSLELGDSWEADDEVFETESAVTEIPEY